MTKTTARNPSSNLFLNIFSAKMAEISKLIDGPRFAHLLRLLVVHTHRRDLLIFFRMNDRCMPCVSSCSDLVSGSSSILTRAPLPSKDRGEIRKIAPSNIILGNFNWISWVNANFRVLSYMALVTSSSGDSETWGERARSFNLLFWLNAHLLVNISPLQSVMSVLKSYVLGTVISQVMSRLFR